MTTIWGDPIEVNGICPGWLTKDDLASTYGGHGWCYEWETEPHGTDPKTWNWPDITNIKLPETHPYYTVVRHNKTNGTSFVYWQGGDEMPGDYGGGLCLWRGGETASDCQTCRWKHVSNDYDIIGYTKKEEEKVEEETAWGDEIVVNGVRPEWLEDGVSLGYTRDGHSWYGPDERFWTEKDIVGNCDGWNSVRAIKLRANHPHYSVRPDGA